MVVANFSFKKGVIMKKFLKLSIIAFSLAGASSVAMAAPQTGSMNISGSIKPGTCTVTIPSSLEFPAFTAEKVNTTKPDQEVSRADLRFGLSSCSGKSVILGVGNYDGLVGGVGHKAKFIFDNKPSGATDADNPVYLQIMTQGKVLSLNNTNKIPITDQQDAVFYVLHKESKTANGYEGKYHTNLKMNFSYK